MSLNDGWAQELDSVVLSYMYATYNPMIWNSHRGLKTKGEQDVAWAVKHEFERRLVAERQAGTTGGVWVIGSSGMTDEEFAGFCRKHEIKWEESPNG